MAGEPPRLFEELRSAGLLWLINRVVFHPRGFALALVKRDGEIVGWTLQGDGSEVWQFNGDEDESFEAVAETLAQAAIRNGPITRKPGPAVPSSKEPTE